MSSIFPLFLVLLAACGSADSAPTSDVYGSSPWQGGESLVYEVKTGKGQRLGRETLSIDVEGASTTLTQLFTGEGRRDQSTVIVDSATFKPRSSRREIITPSSDDVVEATYTDEGVLIRQGDKQSGLSVPEHSYDNDTSLFLWRTLPFASDYKASYVTIITNFRSRQTVSLEVKGRETVRVPAGEFQAWRLEIKTSNASQVAWYADTPSRPLVKYDNDRNITFELESLAGPAASRP